MEQAFTQERLLAELDRSRNARDLAPSLVRSLSHASTPDLADDQATLIDRAALEALGGSREVDALLRDLDLGLLASLADRCGARAERAGGEARSSAREDCWAVLDLLRRSAVLRRIERDRVEEWSSRVLSLIEASDFTVGPLFRQRVSQYGRKVLFEHTRGTHRTVSWQQAGARVELLSRVLWSLQDVAPPAPIALLGKNRLEMALLDLACLTSGLENILVPANAASAEVAYILRHSKAAVAIVSGEQQLRKVMEHRSSLENLQWLVTVDREPGAPKDVFALDDLRARAERIPATLPYERSLAVGIADRATVMYTSGTTGTPKGIQFSQRNLVFKRFARALAIPEIGDKDVFLCFLPLFHTFGRFLEMLGCVFWGARYCFLESTSVEGLVRGMRRHQPTVFISVPKKWLQLHEVITNEVDSMRASDEEIRQATHDVTGGRLAWGLSAAGHLDSDVFRFFQRQGVELMSGFGMTEATGGITMTPVGGYRDDSLGKALPGIDLKLAEDGELLVRGPYVMMGHLDPPDGEPSFDEAGWLHTGDLMHMDDEGYIRLIDRKKEIYKNIKGETIAPQHIENMFRDFESVGRVFLVGDHREYNTLLVYPNPDSAQLDFSALSEDEIQNHFRSLVVSVNKFLAPYERIVDLAVIDRDLDADRGELTPKGTLRRKTIERNFADVVLDVYSRANLHVGGVELEIPNWVFQALGVTARDIHIDGDALTLASTGSSVTVHRESADLARVGSCLYRWPGGPLNLGTILTSPRLWLGNEGLGAMKPAESRRTAGPGDEELELVGRSEPYSPTQDERDRVRDAIDGDAADLSTLDLAARMLGAEGGRDIVRAIRLIGTILGREESPFAEPARHVIGRAASAPSVAVRRRALRLLLPAERLPRFRRVLRSFVGLARDAGVLDDKTRKTLASAHFSKEKIEKLFEVAQEACTGPPASDGYHPLAVAMLRLLAEYGARHPVQYRRIRAFLERMNQFSVASEVRHVARRTADDLLRGFRQWLGPNAEIAVDPETGQEYRWDDVVAFDEGVSEEDRARLLTAIRETALLREAVFLFSTGMSIRLSDIPPRGVWIRLIGSRHGKSVYRITVQTRFQGAYDLAVNVSHERGMDQIAEETHWLILSSAPGERDPLVEDFGGYWPEHNVWTEEFIVGETLDRSLRRLARKPDDSARLQQIWPFLAWSTLTAYVDFWQRSGKRLEIADPGMTNVVVPTEDYKSGVRIVSLSHRRPHDGLLAMLKTFRRDFLAPAEEQYPHVEGLVGWTIIFSSVLEVLGEKEGLSLFREALRYEKEPLRDPMTSSLMEYIDAVEQRGFVPMRLHFASERYRRWSELSSDATAQARARTLQELYETYGLERLARTYPATRVRFFGQTVFHDSSDALRDGLEEIIRRLRNGELDRGELIGAVDELRPGMELSEEEEYFLARMSYPYLRPEDAAGFVRSNLGGERHSEIVVGVEDDDGRSFQIRHALTPKEVERLYRLFLAANLDVHFRMEHRYLVAIDDRSQIAGGVYYEVEEGGQAAHLEKIVVADAYRRRGVAGALMKDFFNRLRTSGVKTVTTGFFRPEYFYGHGFQIEKRYAGLVKSLETVGS